MAHLLHYKIRARFVKESLLFLLCLYLSLFLFHHKSAFTRAPHAHTHALTHVFIRVTLYLSFARVTRADTILLA